jgi:hypothetical protein
MHSLTVVPVSLIVNLIAYSWTPAWDLAPFISALYLCIRELSLVFKWVASSYA